MRHALRSLLSSPGFTLIALLTLALGIGANTTAFSVLNALLMHQVPYPEPQQLVRVFRTSSQSQRWPHAPANFVDHREQNTVFERMAAFQWTSFNLADPGEPADHLRGLAVTADFLPLLGIQPTLGRMFTAQEDQPGNNAVVVLTHGTWLERFGAAPDVVGRVVRIDGEPATIIGVMPPGFDDYKLWGEIAMLRPIAFSKETRADRDNNYLNVIARIKPGVTFAQAQAHVSALAAQLAAAYPEFNAGHGLRLLDLGASIQDEVGRGITWLVMGLAGFVLLIACANLANLQFARSAARGREHAIRAALGASRAQLMSRVLTESLLLSLVGGGLGLLVALWSNDLVGRNFVWGTRQGIEVPLDPRVLAFTFAASVLTGIGFGILPAWMASRADVSDALKQGSRGSTSGRSHHRLRHALIVAEVALALMLLAGASFFVRGLQVFAQRDPGWQTENMVTAYVSLRGQNYTGSDARRAFLTQLQDRLGNVPGVDGVAVGTSLPTFGFSSTSSFAVEGSPQPAPGQSPAAETATVLPGYFETLGIRLVQGRDFTFADRHDTTRKVIINEAMAKALWPGESALGKRLGSVTPYMETVREIIGVVSDVRPAASLGAPSTPFQMYRALLQERPWDFATIALRTSASPEAIARDLRRIVAQLDPDQAIYRVSTVRQDVGRTLASIDVAAWSLVSFALLGLLLAAIGIYGVIANSVVQRTNEIGIRMALGAQVRDVFTLILSGGLRLTLIGTVIGLAGAFGIARLLRSITPELPGTDPLITVAVTLFLIAVALFACWLPARRAAKLDPMTALRAE